MPPGPDDIGFLPEALSRRARRTADGYPVWHESVVESVIIEIAVSGRIVRGLNPREYKADGTFSEAPWGDGYAGDDPDASCESALAALRMARERLPTCDQFQVVWDPELRDTDGPERTKLRESWVALGSIIGGWLLLGVAFEVWFEPEGLQQRYYSALVLGSSVLGALDGLRRMIFPPLAISREAFQGTPAFSRHKSVELTRIESYSLERSHRVVTLRLFARPDDEIYRIWLGEASDSLAAATGVLDSAGIPRRADGSPRVEKP